MDKILLPKKYLSWSQLSCWDTNPTRYRREYFECGRKLDTKYLRFGKNIAKLIEEGKHKELIPDLVVYDSPEFKIETDILGVPVLSFIDSYNSKDNVFYEYKTGIVPWDRQRVIKHGQLVFYATALKHSIGKIPEYCDLVWIETKEGKADIPVDDFWRENEKMVNLTGRVLNFHREFDEREIEKMENQIVKVAYEISEAYKKFIEEI